MRNKFILISIAIITILWDILFGFALAYYGPNRFITSWWQTNSKLASIIFIGAIIIIFLSLFKISNKKDFVEVKKLKKEICQTTSRQSKYSMMDCPKCQHTTYYFYQGEPDAPCILECWSCHHRFSFVWCDKCGMGSDFIKNIQKRPASWQCPDCEFVYSLSPHIYENPITTFDFSALPQSTRIIHLQTQYDYQVKSTVISVFIFSAIAYIFLLMMPVNEVLSFYTTKPEINSIFKTIPKIVIALSVLPGIFLFFLAAMGNILLPIRLIEVFYKAVKHKKEDFGRINHNPSEA